MTNGIPHHAPMTDAIGIARALKEFRCDLADKLEAQMFELDSAEREVRAALDSIRSIDGLADTLHAFSHATLNLGWRKGHNAALREVIRRLRGEVG